MFVLHFYYKKSHILISLYLEFNFYFIRPSDILRFYRDSSSFFFFRHLPSDLAERNSPEIGHMLGSKCDLKMRVRNLEYTLPLKIGDLKHVFSTISQLSGNFNGLYLPNEIRYRQLGKCVANYMGSLTSPQNVMNFGSQTA